MSFEQEKPLSAFRIGLHCGLISGAANILYEQILVGFDMHHKAGFLPLIVPALLLISILILALRKFKRSAKDRFKLKHAVLIGLIIALITASLLVSYRLIYTNLIEPEFYTRYIEANRESFYETHVALHPGMTPEQFDIDMQEGIDQPWKPQYTLTFIAQIILSLLVTLIGGLIIKSKKPKS